MEQPSSRALLLGARARPACRLPAVRQPGTDTNRVDQVPFPGLSGTGNVERRTVID